MLKLVTHLVVGCGLWYGLQVMGLGLGWRIGAILAGATAVHLVWERFFVDPGLYLGAMPIAADDPLMVAAMAKGRETLPEFLKIYPDHASDSMVKFKFITSSGEVEWLWGDLLGLEEDRARVYIRTPPTKHEGTLDRTMMVALSDVVDWQVECRDGTLRGGFTNQAMFKVFQRQEGYLPGQFVQQLQRFKEL